MSDSLPVEIVTQILLRLPLKSIIISTSVCKTWKSIIQNPTFISTYLHHSTTINHHHHLLLFRLCEQRNPKEVYLLLNDEENFTQHPTVVNTCNGLVCLSDDLFGYANQFFLWNPCLRKFINLAYPNVNYRSHGGFDASIGFGFDSKTNDYKVVRVVTLVDNPDSRKDRPVVEVHSLSTGEWRMVTALPPICTLLGCTQVGFVDGALHWLAFRRNDDDHKFHHFVLVFDLVDEVFREILLPELPGYETTYKLEGSVSVYGNSLALFQKEYNNGQQNIWVMKEYGVASSWTKVLTIPNQDLGVDIPMPLGFRRNGEVILKMDDGQLVSVDLGNDKRNDLGISSYGYTFVDLYVESLVLLDKATNGAVTY
ncbi:F-box/kelch-repeat protein At3g06240-like isoform X1 [Fagus crenata]